ncbi:MAG: MFS transporter [Bifidobacteriaceae bacterium]|jgi:MFS family permease|nr:MFS transporter [Bifidobacteriaceae bacterium]
MTQIPAEPSAAQPAEHPAQPAQHPAQPAEQPAEPAEHPARPTTTSHTPTLKQLGLRKLLATLPLAIAGFTIFWGAVQYVLIPIQVQAIDPEGQNSSLALIVALGAVAAMIGAPIAGTLTDRTRTRLGGRAPWLIGAALTTLGLGIVMSLSTSIAMLVVMMVLVQLSTQFILTPISAYIPDRVPAVKRGLFSAAYGAAQVVGSVIGQTLGATLSDMVIVGYVAAGGILAGLVLLFALGNVRSNRDEPRPVITLRSVLSTFWVNPVKHPNFWWAFFGRFLLFVGFFPVQTFLLYLLQDYIGLGDAAVDAVPLLSVNALVGQIVGAVLAGAVFGRVKRTKPLIFAASALLAVALFIPMIWPTLIGMATYSLLSGLGIGAYISIDLVLITLVLPSAESTGKDLGIVNITTTLPQTIGSAIGAGVIGAFGGYFALLPMAVITTVVGATLLIFIRGVK